MKTFVIAFLLVASLAFGQPTVPINNARLSGTALVTQTGTLGLLASTSGTMTFGVPSTVTSYTFKFPANAGTSGYVLSTDGSGNTSWIAGGGGGGSGTVTSFSAGNLSPLFTTSVATTTTTPALSFALTNAAINTVFAGPASGSTGAPAYRALVAKDIPVNVANFNVIAYGATGDGTTDDTVAINAAMTAAGSGQVIFPPGTYRITSTLTLVSGQKFSGAGGSQTTIIKKDFNGTMIVMGDLSAISDITLNGNVSTRTGKGIVVSGNFSQRIERVRVYNMDGNSIEFLADKGVAAVISECELESTNGAAIKIASDDTPSGAKLRMASNCWASGADIDISGCYGFFIENSYVRKVVTSSTSRTYMVSNTRIAAGDAALTISGEGGVWSGCLFAATITLSDCNAVRLDQSCLTTGGITTGSNCVSVGYWNDAGLSFSSATNAYIFMDSASSSGSRALRLTRGGLDRWFVGSSINETGSGNAGSDYVLAGYNDAGTLLDNWLIMRRSTGSLVLSSATPSTSVSTGAVTTGGGIGAVGAGWFGAGVFSSGSVVQSSGSTGLPAQTGTGIVLSGEGSGHNHIYFGDGSGYDLNFSTRTGSTTTIRATLTEGGAFSTTGTITPVTGTAPTTASAGNMAFDTNAWASGRGAIQVYDGTANTYVVAALASDTPTNGQVPTWNTGGTVTWETPSTGNVTASGTLTSGNIAIGGGTTVVSTTATGTGVVTAIASNVGSAGAIVVNGGVLGTPSSGNGSNIANVNAATLGGSTFASPGAIGGTTPAAGTFTTVTVTKAFLGSAATAISASDIDWSLNNSFTKTLSANTTFTFSNLPSGTQTISVVLTNTASNYTVTWPTVSWSGGTPPTMTTGAHTDVYTFIKVGSTIYGSAVQNF